MCLSYVVCNFTSWQVYTYLQKDKKHMIYMKKRQSMKQESSKRYQQHINVRFVVASYVRHCLNCAIYDQIQKFKER